MSLRKVCLLATVLSVLIGTAWADPMRTIFTKENKMPGRLKPEISLAGGGSSFELNNGDDVSRYFITPAVRFGFTDRFAMSLAVPYAGYSDEIADEGGLGDIEIGADFLFYEDIFEYGWVLPHATAIFATGDEEKGLGTGEGQGRFGISIGTTRYDVLHWALDVSYTLNGGQADIKSKNGDREGLFTGALSLIWDLDDKSSVFGEVQFRDDAVDPNDSFALRGHLGGAYRINSYLSLMGYLGVASGLAEDYYGMGRLVCQF